MKERRISIYTNNTEASNETCAILKPKLESAGFFPVDGFDEQAELLICIGGDGTVLQAMHELDFPDVPMIGINTGHLGFFQELYPSDIDTFIFNYSNKNYTIQTLATVKASVLDKHDREHVFRAMNEIVIRGIHRSSTHMSLSIGGSFIERFSGDGILLSTPSGSTAYNYSLGGAIVDPRLNLFQVTPLAPMNTTAYRSFTSSILLPGGGELSIVPDMDYSVPLAIVRDGYVANYDTVRQINIGFSDLTVRLIRFEGYDFWTKVKSKFL